MEDEDDDEDRFSDIYLLTSAICSLAADCWMLYNGALRKAHAVVLKGLNYRGPAGQKRGKIIYDTQS